MAKRNSRNSLFHSYVFCSLFSQMTSVIFSLLVCLLNGKNPPMYSHNTTRTALHLIHSTKLSPGQRSLCLDGLPNMNTPYCNNSFFSSLSKAIIVTAELPVLCNVFFSIYQLFGSNNFAMSVFIFETFIYNTVYM